MEKRSYNLLKKKIDKLICEALKKQVFTACSVGFMFKSENTLEGNIFSYGYTGEAGRTIPVNEETIFDLASLTKPLVTSLSLLALLEEGKLHLDDTLQKFSETILPDKKEITLFHLLTHSSGLPAHRPYYKKLVDFSPTERMERLTDWILAENLIFQPGTANLYSDLGFILLGRIIETVSGEPLDEYWQTKIIRPLALEKGLFFANKLTKGSAVYAATGGVCDWSKKTLSGTVHDDNCRALGGVAGHAGLFGTAKAVLSLCENIMLQFRGERQHPSYSSENLRKVFVNKHGTWMFGFDTPTTGCSSSGKYFSEMTVGHLGFTGTSFWIDLQYDIAIVFLTNRVICGESLTPIRTLRPLLHDCIMEFIKKKSG
jgi:CubicO group peptidase (beta-lactamase class C family)